MVGYFCGENFSENFHFGVVPVLLAATATDDDPLDPLLLWGLDPLALDTGYWILAG